MPRLYLYLTNGADWSVTALSPDTYDKNIWNPLESATIVFAAVPPPKAGSKGTVVIGTPLGVTASAYFSMGGAETCSSSYYLHNNPTPPVAATSSQTSLPLTTGPALVATLHNYDQDRDAQSGLLIAKGGTDENEAGATKHPSVANRSLVQLAGVGRYRDHRFLVGGQGFHVEHRGHGNALPEGL